MNRAASRTVYGRRMKAAGLLAALFLLCALAAGCVGRGGPGLEGTATLVPTDGTGEAATLAPADSTGEAATLAPGYTTPEPTGSAADNTDPPGTAYIDPGPEFWAAAERELAYYKEIALNSEHGTADGKVHKWLHPVKLYIYPSDCYNKYAEYIGTVLETLNAIEGFPGIVTVTGRDGRNSAELTLRFVSVSEIDMLTEGLSEHAYGYSQISWYSASGEIFSGEVYVVDEAYSSEADVRHTLLEELTQALGLMNDSYRYADSIFYQGYSTVDKLSETDLLLLRLHYNVEISGGMAYDSVSGVVKRHTGG